MLEVKHLTAGYGNAIVLRDVSLSVPDGSVVALLGPNGAGKTTLLSAVSGFVKATSGSIVFDGEDITACKPHSIARKGLCYLPEQRGIFPSLTVRENLVLHSPSGKVTPKVDQAVSTFPALGGHLKQLAGSLSGGQQQMLALARTFVSEPKLVLVDEASLGLAPLVVDRIFETLDNIVATGTSVLLVEQYVTRALAMADSAYLLNRGEVVFSGRADELRSEEVFEHYLGIDAYS